MGSELSDGKQRLCKAVYCQPYEDLTDHQQETFDRIVENMPEKMIAGVEGDLLTKQELAEGLSTVFTRMKEDEDIPDEWVDGAAVLCKGMQKWFGMEEGP